MKIKWQAVHEKVKIREFNPMTAGKNKRERKEILRDKLKEEIGKDLGKIQTRCLGHSLFVDACFYLLKSGESGRSKKDLDNLLKNLCDVLAVDMISKPDSKMKGLGLVTDDSFIHKIHCEKKCVNSEEQEGFDLLVSRSNRLLG